MVDGKDAGAQMLPNLGGGRRRGGRGLPVGEEGRPEFLPDAFVVSVSVLAHNRLNGQIRPLESEAQTDRRAVVEDVEAELENMQGIKEGGDGICEVGECIVKI